MYGILTAALLTFTASTTPVTYTAEEARDAAIFSVMSAYEEGYIEIGRTFSQFICAHERDLPADTRSFKITCSQGPDTTFTPTISYTATPAAPVKEGEPIRGGDDTYAADGSIRIWAIQKARNGTFFKVTTTVYRNP